MKRTIALLLGLLCFVCQTKPSTATTDSASQPDSGSLIAAKSQAVVDLENRILALHDSVMPAMSDLMQLKKQLANVLDELEKEPASTEVRHRKEQAIAVKVALERADMSMMDWMHTYNGDTLAQLDEQQALLYLKEQQLKVESMSQLMRKSIDEARTYLK